MAPVELMARRSEPVVAVLATALPVHRTVVIPQALAALEVQALLPAHLLLVLVEVVVLTVAQEAQEVVVPEAQVAQQETLAQPIREVAVVLVAVLEFLVASAVPAS